MPYEVLDIKIRDDGTRVVTSRLVKMGDAGARAGQRVQRSMKSIGEEANVLSRQIFIVRRALTTLFAATGVSAATRMVNEFTNMNNQLRTVTRNEEQLIQRRKELLAISKDSLTPFKAINELYARTKRASKELGYSDKELLKFTKALAQETTLSGATTYEAENAIRQLTQGMGAAGLKGEELRSVLEQLPTVAKRIADGLGVSVGALRELGAAGKISGKDVIEAMLNSADEIEASFKDVVIAPERAFEILKDQIREYVGETDRALGISQSFSRLMLEIAANVGGVVRDAFTLATTASLVYVGWLTKAAIASKAVTAATTEQAAATTALAAAQRSAAAAGTTQVAANAAAGGLFTRMAAGVGSFLGVLNRTLGRRVGLLLLVGTFIELNREINEMTGNTSGLPGIFRLLAIQMRKLGSEIARVVSDFGEFLNKYIPFLDFLQHLPSFKELGDAIGITSLERDPAIQAEARKRALESLAKDPFLSAQAATQLNRGRPADQQISPDSITAQQLDLLESQRLPPFFAPNRPSIEGQGTTKLREELKVQLEIVVQDVLAQHERATGTTSFTEAGVRQAFEEEKILERKLELQQQIKDTLLQIREISVQSPDADPSVTEAFDQQADSILRVMESLGDSSNIEVSKQAIAQYRDILASLTPELDKLDKVTALQDATNAKTEELKKNLESSYAALEEQTKDLTDEQKATALAGAQDTINAATQLLEQAAERLKVSIAGAFANVLTQINAAAKTAATASGNKAAAPPPLPGSITPQAGSGTAIDEITQLNTQLDAANQKLYQLQQQGVQSFGSLGSAGQRAGDQINNIFTNAFSSLEDALVQFVTTGKLDFKQLINAMLADLARLVIRMLIIQPLMGFFGGFFGGFGFSGGGFLGDLTTPSFGAALPGFAMGGLVDDPFANVPRFAGGGRVSGPGTGVSDSVPALLSRKEFVVNAAATSRNLPALRTLNRTGDLPSGGATVNFAPNTVINVSGGQDGAKQGRNAAREFNAMIEAKFNELIRREKRSGGALSSTTQDLY